MNWAQSALAELAGASLEATVVLVVALGSSVLMRRGAARARYALWSTAILSILMLPALTCLLPVWQFQVPWQVHLPSVAPLATDVSLAGSEMPSGAVARQFDRIDSEGVAPVSPVGQMVSVPSETPRSMDRSWPLVVLGAWLAGVALVLGRLMVGVSRARGTWSRARPLEGERWRDLIASSARQSGFSRGVSLRASEEIGTPMTWGLRRSVILLPEGAETWSDDCLRAVLLHEMVHLRHGDWLLQLLAQGACAVYWFHPLTWLAARLHAVERECSCDEVVVSRGTAPPEYATHLLEVARFVKSRAIGPLATLSMVRRGQLEGRIMRILKSEATPRGRGLLPALTMSAIVLGLAMFEIRPEPMAQESEHRRDSKTTSTWSSHDDSGRFNFQMHGDDGFTFEVGGWGDVDFGSQLAMEPGSVLVLETRDDGSSQRLRITADDGGEPSYDWRLDGEARPYDDQARAWLNAALRYADGKMEVSRLRGQVSSLRGKISSLRGQESSLRGKISSLRGQESSLRGQISSLRGEVSSLRGKISSIRGQESSLRGQISGLRGQISSLRAQRRRAPESRDLVDRQIADLEERITGIEAEIQAFDAESRIREIEAEIDTPDFERRRQAVHDRIEALDVDGRSAEIRSEIEALDVDGRSAEIRAEIEALDVDRRSAEIHRQQIEPAYKDLRQLMEQIAGD